MPTVLRTGPYRFFFYSNENREPAHVHVSRDLSVAKFWLAPVSLAKSTHFTPIELGNIQKLVKANERQLVEAWYEYFKK